MKTIKYMSVFVIAALTLSITSCTKEEGFTGKGKIEGTVTYPGGNASGAVVSIAFGATTETSDFDYSTVTDSTGKYSFEALSKGDYFVDATYTNSLGYTFQTGGAHVELGSDKSDATVNLELQ